LEYLLAQKLELQTKLKKYEEQERKKSRKVAADKQEEDQRELKEFQQTETAILSVDHNHKRALGQRSKAAVQEQEELQEAKRLRKGELLDIDKSKFRSKCFWVKETTQNAAPIELKPVDTTVKCPMSGKKLRAKDLLPLKFEITDQKLFDAGGGKGVFCCAVSKHPITHQQAVVLKPSGVVVLESVLKDIVFKEMRCPITGKKLNGKEDILKLQMGGTGFSAHNDIEASSFSTIRSFGGDARTQQGHLPKAGYVGLH